MTEIMGLNIFDIVVLALILLLSIKGLISGFTKELFSAIGLIGGIFVASYLHKDVANYIYTNLTNAVSIKLLNLISLIVIFVLFFIIAKYIGKGLSLISSDDYISATSRFAGMIIKMFTLFFVFSLIVYAFSTREQVVEKFKDTLSSSKLYPLLKETGATILNMPIISNVSNSKNESNSTIVISHNDENISKAVTEEENNNSNEKIANDINNTIEEHNKTSNKKIVEDSNITKESNKDQENKSIIDNNITKLEQNSSVK